MQMQISPKMIYQVSGYCLLILAVVFCSLNAFAIPDKIAVSGTLTDATGNPIAGDFQMMVSFYSEPSEDALIGSTTMEISVDGSYFIVAVSVPAELTVLDRAWYVVSVDIDHDGFDPEDRFEEFHEIYAVPFALSGKPVDYFETLGGHHLPFFGSTSGTFLANKIVVVPFSTPPGGVRFNRLALRAAYGGISSYGIYDSSGELVISTAGRAPDVMGDPFVFFIEGKLAPSRIYYSAYTSTTTVQPPIRMCMVPTIPGVGRIPNGGINGQLPNKLDFDKIQTVADLPALSFGLYYVDDNSPSIMKAGRSKSTREEDLAPEIQEMIKNIRESYGTLEEKP